MCLVALGLADRVLFSLSFEGRKQGVRRAMGSGCDSGKVSRDCWVKGTVPLEVLYC